ncbi:tRNA 2-thiouridine(34) synthase MnmA [Maricaulis alexandrii]|uniref:tRNA 2-thiouridine(34) synthase MnmA n=1 Tax=Maricaulis alexandrii TaxID=2570354 RepID=UPI001108F98E|nr:tRNA 2-thiouridine(34) synthase MnmA [Maricaulis alexandrii]
MTTLLTGDAATRADELLCELNLSGDPLGLGGHPGDHRVVVAMSGGVDSSVTAAVLHRLGYDVVGVTLQLYDHGAAIAKKGACCAGQDIYDAKRVAEACGFPHYVLDYESRFREAVIEEFADTYLAGYTPIPCVRCNQTVKFADLLETAKQLGARCMATGHYIQRVEGENGPELRRAADAGKDQSYFLFATTHEQLNFLRFPLGHLNKDQTRRLAEAFGLIVADKPDSQDICFVPNGRYVDIVEKVRPGASRPGQIVHVDGRVLGEHEGVIRYTVGQRRGLNIALGEPLYVVRLDAETAEVVVGPREALEVDTIVLKDINWLGDDALSDGAPVRVKVRSTRPPVPAALSVDGDTIGVVLAKGEEGVAPGQACVFYSPDDEDRVLGGGWIAGTSGRGTGGTGHRLIG